MFELIGLTNSWFAEADLSQLEILARVINKSYDKARHKFGIIGSTRVKTPSTFLTDFNISANKPFVLFLFLGPESIFREFAQDGYVRDFLKESSSVEDAFDCDIAESCLQRLSFASDDVKLLMVSDTSYKISKEQESRILGTIGFKFIDDSQNSYKELELTAFTSFMRQLGPKLFNTVAEKVFTSSNAGFDNLFHIDRSHVNRFRIHSLVIREHDLVRYYTTKCQFVPSDKEDMFLEIDEHGYYKGNDLEEGIIAFKSFHLSFLYRDIPNELQAQSV